MGSGGVAIAALPTVICLKVPFSDSLGGGKTGITTRPEIVSIPQIPENASVASITFRNKLHGWKSYRMEIKLEYTQKRTV